MQRRTRSPALMLAQGGAQCLAGDVEAAAFIAKDVTPTTGPGGFSGGVAAEGELPGAGDGDDAGRAGRRTGEGDVPSWVTNARSLGTSSASRLSLSAGPPLKPAQRAAKRATGKPACSRASVTQPRMAPVNF